MTTGIFDCTPFNTCQISALTFESVVPDSELHLLGFQLLCTGHVMAHSQLYSVLNKTCSPHIEEVIIECKLFNSPRTLSSFILVGVYNSADHITKHGVQRPCLLILGTLIEQTSPKNCQYTMGEIII